MDSFGRAVEIIWFILAPPGCRRVHSDSLSSLGRALCVVVFIRVRWVHSGRPCASSGSFGLVGFILVRPSRGRDCLVSSGSFGRALGDVVFIGFIRAHRGVHSGSLGLFGSALAIVVFIWLVGFIRARCGGRCVHSGVPPWMHSISPWGSSGSCGFFLARPGVHLGSLGLFRRALGVVLFNLGVIGFIRSRPGGGRVYFSSLGLFGRALGDVIFIRASPSGRWVHWCSLGSF